MPYDETLKRRVDSIASKHDMVFSTSNMFGGMAYFVKGNMCFAIMGEVLLVRSKPDGIDELLQLPGTHEAVMGARQMIGWLMASGPAISNDDGLYKMMQVGIYRALELPPKAN